MITNFKIYENENPEYETIYLKDYWDRDMDVSVIEDIKKLKKKHIQFKVFHHKEKNDNFFKIIIDATFGVFNDIIITQLGFKYFIEYSKSWDWEEINEKDIEYIITTDKYNI